MRLRLRLLVPAVIGVLVLGACAVDDDQRSTTGTTVADDATADISSPDVTVPDRTTTDTTMPDTTIPDTTVSDATVSDTTPDVAVSETPPRVLIDTDLGGEGRTERGSRSDPDDIQSLVRAVQYSDALGIEGIISTYGPGLADPDLIRE